VTQQPSQKHEVTVVIRNRLGLHARPAMTFVDKANGFDADIHVSKGAQRVNGKSIMQMMMLAATEGTELKIEAEGPEAGPAIEALQTLVDERFGET